MGFNVNLNSRDNLQKATMSDLTITDPGRKAYGEIIDLTGKEYVVGDYILADGTRKPIYRKTVTGSSLPLGDTTIITGVDTIINAYGHISWKNIVTSVCGSMGPVYVRRMENTNNASVFVDSDGADANTWKEYVITVEYTKTTDTPT